MDRCRCTAEIGAGDDGGLRLGFARIVKHVFMGKSAGAHNVQARCNKPQR
jgi:hypothetical protein